MALTKRLKALIKAEMPYYGAITTKGRYTGVKAKAWAILSDYVRCRDFLRYGKCVATGERVYDWKGSDAGHFIVMASNGALIGFSEMNVHMQSKHSNHLSSAADGAEFERELIRRYGKEIITDLKNLKNATVKADDIFFLNRIKYIYKLFQKLKLEYPNHDYPEYI